MTHRERTDELRQALDRGAIKKFINQERISISVLYAAFRKDSIGSMTPAQRDAYAKFVAFAYTQQAIRSREIQRIEKLAKD